MARKTMNEQRQRRHRRLRKRLVGTPERPRLCVYRSLQHTSAQVVDDGTGHVLAIATTICKELRQDQNANMEAAKRIGTAIAERAKAAGIEQVIFDRNGWQFHGRVRAVAEAAREAGLRF